MIAISLFLSQNTHIISWFIHILINRHDLLQICYHTVIEAKNDMLQSVLSVCMYKHSILTVFVASQSEISRRLEKAKSYEHDETNRGPLSRSEISLEEHPLSLGKTSIWNQYFQVSFIIKLVDSILSPVLILRNPL